VTSDILKQKRNKGGRGVHISFSEGKTIRYDEAKAFKNRYGLAQQMGITMRAGGMDIVAFGDRKTNPNINVMGVDESYFNIAATKLEVGRGFSPYELQAGSYVCVLGNGIATKLFKTNVANAVGKVVSLGAAKLRVVGVAESKGGNMMMNSDNMIFLPLETARALYGNGTFAINVAVAKVEQKPVATDEAEGLFRVVRKVPLGAESNFSINQNDSLANMLIENLSVVKWTAVILGIITLFGSAIGLMNIMLVSVAERTREIGVNKAMGARNGVVRGQFLTEAILISLLGGTVGIILGMLAGFGVSVLCNVPYSIPWIWIGGGIAICTTVGVISGIYPAIKASRLDPIVALRYE
jgi:putative ABC transport system permease protein